MNRFVRGIFAAGAALMLATPLQAAVVNWTASGTTGDYNVAANWSSNPSLPASRDLLYVGNATRPTGTMNISADVANSPAFLYAGTTAGTNGTILQSGGILHLTGGMSLGVGGGTGAYTGNGGRLILAGTENGIPLLVGSGAGSNGTITMHNGATMLINATQPSNVTGYIGDNGGTGALNMYETSSMTATGNLYFGRGTGSSATATLNNSSALNVIHGWFLVGGGYDTTGGTAVMTLNDSAKLYTNSANIIGYRGANGHLTLNGTSTMTAAGGFQVANSERYFADSSPVTTGTVDLNDSAKIITTTVQLTNWFNSNATMNMTGNSSLTSNAFWVGHYGGTATLNMSGNSSIVNTGDLQGTNSERYSLPTSGTINMTDNASFTVGNFVLLGAWKGATGTLNLSGNSRMVQTGGQFHIGDGGGTGIVTMSGTSSLSNTGTYVGVRDNGATGTLSLNGGTLTTPFIRGSAYGGAQTVNLNGGTIQVAADSGNFIGYLNGAGTNFNVLVNGGVTVKTADIASTARTVRVNVPLQHYSGVTTDGGLTVTGTGNLILAAVNTYNGPTAVNGGTLTVTRDGSLATKNITVASGAMLDLGGAASIAGSLNGLTLNNATLGLALTPTAGSGNTISTSALSLTGSNSLLVRAKGRTMDTAAGGYTIINGYSGLPTGTLTAATNTRAYAATATVNASNVKVALTNTGVSAANLTWAPGALPLTWETRGADAVWNNGSGADTFYELDTVSFPDLGAAQTVTVKGTVHPLDIVVNSANNYTFSGPGRITGDGTTLTKSGAGVLTFDTAGGIDITGDMTISGGTLAFGIDTTSNTSAQGVSNVLSGNVALSNAGTIISVAGNRGVASQSYAAVGVQGAVTLKGVVSDDGIAGVTKAGMGTLTLANTANTYTGKTTINAGILEVASIGNLGSPSSIGASADPASLVLNAASTSAPATLKYVGNSAVTTDRGLVVNGTGFNFVYNDKDITFTGPLSNPSGTGGLFKLGTGALSFTNPANVTIGQVQVVNGVMNITGDGSTTYTLPSTVLVGREGGTAALNLSNVNIVNSGNSGFYLGYNTGTYGYMPIRDGVSITTSAPTVLNNYYVGVHNNSVGIIDQSGGNLQSGNLMDFGSGNEGYGIYNMTGGTATWNCGSNGVRIGDSGNGVGIVNVTGTAHLTTGNVIHLGTYGTSTGILNLGKVGSTIDTDSGVLTTPQLGTYTYTTATGFLNFHGGTLQASKDQNNFFGYSGQITGGAYVYGEGGKIDTQNFDITINMPLSAPTGKGVSSIAVAAQGSGYIGAPAVEISSGSGKGATATAIMNGDKIDHIEISNPGVGYSSSDVLTVKLVGGGGTGATVGTVSFVDNTLATGTLRKLGTGKLNLTTANTYTGVTDIKEGTLALTRTASLASKGVAVANGATLDLSANSNLGSLNTLNLESGSTLGVSLTPATTDPNAIVVAAGGVANTDGISLNVNAQGLSLATGDYTVISSSAIPAGTISTVTTNMRHYAATASVTGTAVTVNVTTTANLAENLTWETSSADWTVGGFGWLGGSDGLFYNLDSVTFDDLGLLPAGKIVNVLGTVHPSAITVLATDTVNPWLFQGNGKITGVGTTMTISGGGAVSFNNVGGLDFTGNLALQGTFETGANVFATTLPGNVQLSGSSAFSVVATTGPLTLTGVVSDTDATGLTKKSGGTLVLANSANTYTGPTIINGGTLKVATLANGGAPSSIGSSSADPANLRIAGNLTYTGPAVTIDRGITAIGGGSITIDNDLTIAGVIAPGTVTNTFAKYGLGTLTFKTPGVTTNDFGTASLYQLAGNMVFDGVAGTTYTASRILVATNAQDSTIIKGDVALIGTNVAGAEGIAFGYGAGAVGNVTMLDNASAKSTLGRVYIGAGVNNTSNTYGALTMNDNSSLSSAQDVLLGNYYGTGVLTMNQTAHITAGTEAYIGNNNAIGIATLNNSSRYEITTNAWIGYQGNGNATVNLNDASLMKVLGTAYIGTGGAGCVGTVNINGNATFNGATTIVSRFNGTGTVNVNDNGTFTGNSIQVGFNWGSVVTDTHGTVNMNGAGAVATANEIILGADGGQDGKWNQNAGHTTVASKLVVGEYDYHDAPANRTAGIGTLNLNGGVVTTPVVTTRSIVVSTNAADKDTILHGATFGKVNFNGGTLQASADSANFIATDDPLATMTLKVQKNATTGLGAVIDTQGYAVTITKDLQHDTAGPAIDGGLSKLGNGSLVLTGALTYTGNTNVAAGTLQISTPGAVTLSTVTGAGTLKVTDGTTLTATSINVDTLTIGGAPAAVAAAVPEPGTFVLLALAGLGVALAAWRRK